MSDPSESVPERRHLPVYAVAGALSLIALALAASTGGLTLERITSLAGDITHIISRVHSATVYYLFIGALCYSATRNTRYLLFGIIGAALDIVVSFIPSWFDSVNSDYRSAASVLYDIGRYIFSPVIVMPFIFLFATRFFGRFERLRVATLALSLALVGLEILLRLSYLRNGPLLRDILTLLYEAVLAALALAVLGAAWCMAFRQAPRHLPPGDATRSLALTCPRCQNPLMIALPHGDCPRCRLQFHIALEEGSCTKCHYPLRGLTGGKCPKCGTPFVESPDPTS